MISAFLAASENELFFHQHTMNIITETTEKIRLYILSTSALAGSIIPNPLHNVMIETIIIDTVLITVPVDVGI